jgi:hypothetical protein
MPRSRHCQSRAAVAARFLMSVVFRSFTLFRTFPFLLPRANPKDRRGERLVNARGEEFMGNRRLLPVWSELTAPKGATEALEK